MLLNCYCLVLILCLCIHFVSSVIAPVLLYNLLCQFYMYCYFPGLWDTGISDVISKDSVLGNSTQLPGHS